MKPIFIYFGLLAFAVFPLVGAESPAVFYQARKIHKTIVSEQDQQQKQAAAVDAIQWATVTDGARIDTEDNGWICLTAETWKDGQSAPVLQAFVSQILKAKRPWTETEKAILQSALTAFIEISTQPEAITFRRHLQAFYEQAFLAESLEQLAQNRMICALLHPIFEEDERVDQFGISPLAKKFNRREIYLKTQASTPGGVSEKAEQKNDF